MRAHIARSTPQLNRRSLGGTIVLVIWRHLVSVDYYFIVEAYLVGIALLFCFSKSLLTL